MHVNLIIKITKKKLSANQHIFHFCADTFQIIYNLKYVNLYFEIHIVFLKV